MNIFFDVDYTILGLDNSLRPDTKETFQALLDEEHKIYIWSGMGERWEVVNKFELNPLVSGVYEKPTHHFHERLEERRRIRRRFAAARRSQRLEAASVVCDVPA